STILFQRGRRRTSRQFEKVRHGFFDDQRSVFGQLWKPPQLVKDADSVRSLNDVATDKRRVRTDRFCLIFAVHVVSDCSTDASSRWTVRLLAPAASAISSRVRH